MDKKVLLIFILLGTAFGLNVTLDMPSEVAVGQDVGAFVTIHGSADKLDIAVLLPEGWHIKEWNVESYDKSWVSFEVINLQAQGNAYEVAHWKFNKKVVDYAKLYFVFTPKEEGSIRIAGFWTTPSEFGKFEGQITVIKPVCGNGICEPSENSENCPQDCGIGRGIFIASMIVLVAVIFIVWLILKKVKE